MYIIWISILLLAFVANLDNLAIGVALGMRLTRIRFRSNLIIALITMTGTFLSMSMGELMSGVISAMVANILGAVMITVIGCWTVISGFRAGPNSQLLSDHSHSGLSKIHHSAGTECVADYARHLRDDHLGRV